MPSGEAFALASPIPQSRPGDDGRRDGLHVSWSFHRDPSSQPAERRRKLFAHRRRRDLDRKFAASLLSRHERWHDGDRMWAEP